MLKSSFQKISCGVRRGSDQKRILTSHVGVVPCHREHPSHLFLSLSAAQLIVDSASNCERGETERCFLSLKLIRKVFMNNCQL